MRKIYFNNNVITFGLKSALAYDFEIKPSAPIEITKVLQKLEFNKDITINGDDIDSLYAEFVTFFKMVDAAGGVVEDSKGRFLMIQRKGKWDLPKGHREVGEDLEVCAVREVEEECGVSDLTIIRHLVTTEHIYLLNGEWILKSTYWYLMSSKGTGELTPQLEEGITDVRWVERDMVSSLLTNSFETIRDVFKDVLN